MVNIQLLICMYTSCTNRLSARPARKTFKIVEDTTLFTEAFEHFSLLSEHLNCLVDHPDIMSHLALFVSTPTSLSKHALTILAVSPGCPTWARRSP